MQAKKPAFIPFPKIKVLRRKNKFFWTCSALAIINHSPLLDEDKEAYSICAVSPVLPASLNSQMKDQNFHINILSQDFNHRETAMSK